MSSEREFAVIGAGAWGTALAAVMARNGNEVCLWGRDEHTVKSINQSHENSKYLPGITLPPELKATGDMSNALSNADTVLLVTPAQSIHSASVTIKDYIDADTPVILCAKGIDRNSGFLPAETIKSVLPENPIAALSGPSFANDVAKGLPTAVTLAAENEPLAKNLSQKLSGSTFRVYASSDLKGVELGGALKNVIALAVGICRGLTLGASAEAALTARGFAELNRLAIALGAKPQTLMGLSGLGDLVLTCSSPQSRNFSYGMHLGSGAATKNLPLAEGALTAEIAAKLATDNQIDCPIIDTVVKVLKGELKSTQAMHALLSRPLKTESE